MSKGSKITLEQHSTMGGNVAAGKLKYDVVALQNRTRPMIGETLTEEDVAKLKAENDGLTIDIKPFNRKRRRN